MNKKQLITFSDVALVQHHLLKEIGNYSSKNAYNYMHNALRNKIQFKDFGISEIDLRSFNWTQGKSNRNWWWQIQSFPFLNWFIEGFDLCTDIEKEQTVVFTLKSLDCWIENALDNKKSPLVWHDHASAFRLRHLVRWINFIINNNLTERFFSEKEQIIILNLVKRHVDFLCEESNYTKHTNHGFDQMFIVYKLSLYWSNTDYLNDASIIAKNRLLNEIAHAFTKQGVHIENSPWYQDFMLSRLKEVTELYKFGDETLYKIASELIDRAEMFLSDITLPDGYLPMIGDTRGNAKGIVSEYKEFEMIDYAESGYCIVRGLSYDKKPFHLIFKCGYLSNYHRHDDDLSIYFYYNDEVVFGDAGLYSYNEKDPKRVFVRSPRGHSTFYPTHGKPIRNIKTLKQSPECWLDKENKKIIGTTYSYGSKIVLKRTVEFGEIQCGKIIIVDEVVYLTSIKNKLPCSTNFIIPAKASNINLDNEKAELDLDLNHLSIRYAHGNGGFYSKWDEDDSDGVFISSLFDQIEHATRFLVQSKIPERCNNIMLISVSKKS